MNKVRVLRAALVTTTVVGVLACSLTAQAFEARLAGHVVTAPSRNGVPAHFCTPKLCYVTPPQHVPGGWPYPFLPALLLGVGLIGAGLWMWLTPAPLPSAAPTTTSSDHDSPIRPDAGGRVLPREDNSSLPPISTAADPL